MIRLEKKKVRKTEYTVRKGFMNIVEWYNKEGNLVAIEVGKEKYTADLSFDGCTGQPKLVTVGQLHTTYFTYVRNMLGEL